MYYYKFHFSLERSLIRSDGLINSDTAITAAAVAVLESTVLGAVAVPVAGAATNATDLTDETEELRETVEVPEEEEVVGKRALALELEFELVEQVVVVLIFATAATEEEEEPAAPPVSNDNNVFDL